jgi:hypothetical protein
VYSSGSSEIWLGNFYTAWEAAVVRFVSEGVACLPKLRQGVFTTAAVDNVDHNPSSTTSKSSFHGCFFLVLA